MMGTVVAIKVFAPASIAAKAMKNAFSAIKTLEAIAHPNKEGSDLYKLNKAAGDQSVELTVEVFRILQLAHRVSALSGGAFDVTFAGVGRLWNFRAEQPRLPDGDELARALKLIDYRQLLLDSDRRSAMLKKKNMRVELGAIAKGWAADMAVAALKQDGVNNAIVNAGGDMAVIGGKEGGKPWRVGVQHPRKPHGKLYGFMEINFESSVATSGDYERFFLYEGKRYHHIFDPRTGWPARGCQSVTIVCPQRRAALSDALSTAVFVLGPEEGLSLLTEHYPGCHALIIDQEGREHASADFYAKTNFSRVEDD